MLIWPPWVLRKIHLRNCFFQTGKTNRRASQKNGFECHTPTSSQSQHLLIKQGPKFRATKSAKFFSTHVTSSLTSTRRFYYDRPMSRRCPIFRRMCGVTAVMMAFVAAGPAPTRANPYLGKPGEPVTTVRAATCALSGGSIHLYAALDNGLFEKYGVKVE